MRRFVLRAAVLAVLALGISPVQADPEGANNPECLGSRCGRPNEVVSPLWDSVAAWLGLDFEET
jgi:hypothetical protein